MDFHVVWGWLDNVLNGYERCFLLHIYLTVQLYCIVRLFYLLFLQVMLKQIGVFSSNQATKGRHCLLPLQVSIILSAPLERVTFILKQINWPTMTWSSHWTPGSLHDPLIFLLKFSQTRWEKNVILSMESKRRHIEPQISSSTMQTMWCLFGSKVQFCITALLMCNNIKTR